MIHPSCPTPPMIHPSYLTPLYLLPLPWGLQQLGVSPQWAWLSFCVADLLIDLLSVITNLPLKTHRLGWHWQTFVISQLPPPQPAHPFPKLHQTTNPSNPPWLLPTKVYPTTILHVASTAHNPHPHPHSHPTTNTSVKLKMRQSPSNLIQLEKPRSAGPDLSFVSLNERCPNRHFFLLQGAWKIRLSPPSSNLIPATLIVCDPRNQGAPPIFLLACRAASNWVWIISWSPPLPPFVLNFHTWLSTHWLSLKAIRPAPCIVIEIVERDRLDWTFNLDAIRKSVIYAYIKVSSQGS